MTERNVPAFDPNAIQAKLLEAFPDIVPIAEGEDDDVALNNWTDVLMSINDLRNVVE